MKKTTLLFIFLFGLTIAYSQNKECDCSGALNKSLKNIYTENQLLELRIELYEYYKFLQNKSDGTSASFELSSAAEAFTPYGIFNGELDGLGVYEKTKVRNLHNIIEKDQSISEYVFKQIATEIFSDNQLEAYKSCLNSCPKQNGVFYEVTGDLEDIFAINLRFTNSVGQEKVTLSNNATLVNCEPIGGFILKKGLTIKNNRSVAQYLKIIDKEKPAQLGINFKELSFSAINLGDEYMGGSNSLPIGTIIHSPFKYETFLEVNNFKPTENMSRAFWVPCDGRNVSSSKYGKFAGNVPDYRGVFLRNVNDYKVSFDGVGKVNSMQANPDNTTAGVFQSDEFSSHHHATRKTSRAGADGTEAGLATHTGVKTEYGYGSDIKHPKIAKEGGNETRPKNYTVYYYIKIN